MKRYTGRLSEKSKQLILDNIKAFSDEFAIGLGRVANDSKTYTIEETVAMYNPGITKEEIQAWVWYRKRKGVPMKSWKKYDVKFSETKIISFVKKGILFYDPTEKGYVPYPVFAFGNLYTKRGKLKSNRDQIVNDFGIKVYDNHVKTLEDLMPDSLSVTNPIAGERPVILSISEFPKEFKIDSLREDSGVVIGEGTSLWDAFPYWLKGIDEGRIKKTSAFEIINFYLNKESKPQHYSHIEWGTIKKRTRDEGERLFGEFLHEALERKDQLRIDADYNSKYNATAPLQYQKIPIGIEVSKKFMGNNLEVRKAQREGIAFMELVGSGIIAYDVGVGKTITAIIEVVTAIKNGKCSRPLICVPNPTYANWMKEMLGIDGMAGVLTGTGITVNDWFNLGKDVKKPDFSKKVPKNSITLVTYEAFQMIGFGEETQQKHFAHLSAIADQNEKGDRDIEKENEAFREVVGIGLKDTVADIEELGFDYVVIDEAHNFKKVFSKVQSGKDTEKRFSIEAGEPSDRGIKAFFLCNYIQRVYGRNVMLLTATPFTNSPLEIYSMLSLVAYEYMKKNNIMNLREFFEQYIAETSEYAVSQSGKITQKNVVKTFNNRISLQRLINSHINFKTGEEANIPRPCKINLPKTTETVDGVIKKLPKQDQILTYLQQSGIQAEIQKEINALASEGASKDDPGRLLSLMADSQNNALSPYLVGKANKSKVHHLDQGSPENYKEFVENSPKIKYTLECIRTVREHHKKTGTPMSGQIIYIDRGKNLFKYIKEWLEKELGFKKKVALKDNKRLKVDEVEFITGGMNKDKKEKIKVAFNEGTCKIIIGTSTIKEGINLQERTSTLYNLYPNWNPTDIRQLEGRAWRQKNKFNFVRVVMPLMENSMDIFVFQKLEEKTSRINDLWTKSDRGNVLDEESLDPSEVKFALVTDMEVLVDHELNQIKEDLYASRKVAEGKLQDVQSYKAIKDNYERLKRIVLADVPSMVRNFNRVVINDEPDRYITFNNLSDFVLDDLPKTVAYQIERHQKAYSMLNELLQGNHTDKDIISAYGFAVRIFQRAYGSYSSWQFEQYKEYVSKVGKIEKVLFRDRGLNEDSDLGEITEVLEKEFEKADEEFQNASSPEFKDEVYMDVMEKKAKFGVRAKSIEDRVKEFASMNHLLDYKFNKCDAEKCTIPSTKFKPEADDKAKKIKLAKAKIKMVAIAMAMDSEF